MIIEFQKSMIRALKFRVNHLHPIPGSYFIQINIFRVSSFVHGGWRSFEVPGEVSAGLFPHPRPDPGIVSKKILRHQMVKIFLMGCLKKYFRVLKFFGCRTGDRPETVPPTPVTVPRTLPQGGGA